MSKANEFEKIAKEIQKKIELNEETDFSKKVIDEYRNPSNFGRLENPDAIGMIKGPCGDTMKISLKIKNNTIIDVRFWTDGCGTSIACGSMITKMIKGKKLAEANVLSSKNLNDALDGLPDNHVHCTVLAVNTLKKALDNIHK